MSQRVGSARSRVTAAVNEHVVTAAESDNRTHAPCKCCRLRISKYEAGAGAVGHGGHYHSQSPEAFFCHMPGIKVCVPAGPADAYALLKAAHADPDPVIVMEPKQLYRTAVEDVEVGRPGDAAAIGKARVARSGTDLTMVAWGQQVRPHAASAVPAGARGLLLPGLELAACVLSMWSKTDITQICSQLAGSAKNWCCRHSRGMILGAASAPVCGRAAFRRSALGA